VNSNQTWSPVFAEVGYDYGLIPGFPGDDDKQCLSSTLDQHLAQNAMRTCDESMSLLVGSELSVGTLKAIVDSMNKDGPSRMPGYCCMVRFKFSIKFPTPCDLSRYEISTIGCLDRFRVLWVQCKFVSSYIYMSFISDNYSLAEPILL
jgi:hypothetical protein